MQGTSSWLWRFNPLLLRLLGEISLSLLCLHSSRVSALDLAPPLHVGRPLESVLNPDRRELKEQLIRGLWLIQAGGGRGTECRESLWQNRSAWHCNNLGRAMSSPQEVVPGSRDTGSGVLHRFLLWGRCGLWPVLAHGILCGCSSSVSISCLPLVSAVVARARAHLWSSFRRCSESPLLMHPDTMVSCLLGSSRIFPGLPPG